jgi:signal transduction histidine kinase
LFGEARAESWRLGRRTANSVVGVAAVIVIGVLILLGVQLDSTQVAAHRDVESRFRARAEVTSALTQAIFSSSAVSPDTAKRYGVPVVSQRVMDEAVKSGHLDYAALLDERGKVIASSSGLTPAAGAGLASRTASLRLTPNGGAFSLSNVLQGGNVIEFAVPVKTATGRRVFVSGLPSRLISAFIGGYLGRISSRFGSAYVIDGQGNVIGSPDPRSPVGRPIAQRALLERVEAASSGSFGPNGYFVAVPVPSTSWRVVLAAPESQLFTSVDGAHKWLPWGIFVAFGIVALAALMLLWRLLGSAAALSEANRKLEASNAQLEKNNALLRHAAELARSNVELEQFASIASHDLQEPLRKVQTFAAQLNAKERDRLSDEGQDYLRRMSVAAGRMRALIDDLLMFSRVSTQARPFAPVDLQEVAAQVMPDLELTIEETGAEVTVNTLPTIDADPVQMRQLLQNLLGNALKFRRDGVVPEVTVASHVAEGVLELTVRDNGIGFDPQYASRVFRAFERLHGASTYPGTGIGLALCRKIVERHNGTITAESSPGNGSTFHVTLPAHQPAGAPDLPAADPVFPSVPTDPAQALV